ncbi:putative hydro-lyase [Arenibaculum pallidiluteum]|uniref:putative hydro-lyase n=1 Tax=Arenibaculum pallidiluteum TaxID=2812559 RepID=UPI002E2A28FA|nr:putative hydro-lyase [Arenibaculum pallidiluteum]
MGMDGTIRPEAAEMAGLSAHEVRMRIRSGGYTGPTAGLARGMVQGNLAILPADWAAEFLRFCQRNPKPCPVLAVSDPGSPALPELGLDIDIRTDIPRYRVYRDGELVDEPTDVRSVWRDDLVTFVIGCSFSFETPLHEAGLGLRHWEQNLNVPMYRSNIETNPTERFGGPMVVSMRPFKPADAIRAIQVTSRFPSVHGAPVHIGLPEQIGIRDLSKPDFGDAVRVDADELPVFWACGVTPQVVIQRARPPLLIAHSPGHMLVCDVPNARLAAL